MVGPEHRKAHLRARRLDIDRAHVGFRGKPVADHGLGDPRPDFAYVGVVHAENRNAVEGKALEKVDEGALQAFEIMPVGIHVIFVDIGDR